MQPDSRQADSAILNLVGEGRAGDYQLAAKKVRRQRHVWFFRCACPNFPGSIDSIKVLAAADGGANKVPHQSVAQTEYQNRHSSLILTATWPIALVDYFQRHG